MTRLELDSGAGQQGEVVLAYSWVERAITVLLVLVLIGGVYWLRTKTGLLDHFPGVVEGTGLIGLILGLIESTKTVSFSRSTIEFSWLLGLFRRSCCLTGPSAYRIYGSRRKANYFGEITFRTGIFGLSVPECMENYQSFQDRFKIMAEVAPPTI